MKLFREGTGGYVPVDIRMVFDVCGTHRSIISDDTRTGLCDWAHPRTDLRPCKVDESMSLILTGDQL